MSAPGSPGVTLLLEVIRASARGRRCASCGRDLSGATADLRDLDLERAVAGLRCACGALERVEVRPSSDGGTAAVS